MHGTKQSSNYLHKGLKTKMRRSTTRNHQWQKQFGTNLSILSVKKGKSAVRIFFQNFTIRIKLNIQMI